jgi:hypothetical protein
MRDLQTHGWMWAKAVLFVLIGILSSILILVQLPDWRVALLLGLAIWAFCRAYYFAFYVIGHYVDPSFRFSGLFSVARYLWKKRAGK